MRTQTLLAGVMALALAQFGAGDTRAEPCMSVTLTGVQGGPPLFNGQAGAGTLVRYGDETNDCAAVHLQFDTGRGTNMRLSQLRVPPGRLDAVFLTHMHSDHTEGLADIAQLRWHFNSAGPKLDLVCSADAPTPFGVPLSCARLAAHIGDPFIQSGEIAQRRAENEQRLEGGPADLLNVVTFDPGDEPQTVWQSGEVTVSAIGSTHIAGHASYRVDTPAGSVVIGGDAGNAVREPPRETSTSNRVEKLAMGADVIVHSTIHPVMGPDGGTGFPPPIYWRQSTATDLGAMAKRTGSRFLMLTHLIPPVGTPRQGPYELPNGPLAESDYKTAVDDSGFEGTTIVGSDLATLKLPAAN